MNQSLPVSYKVKIDESKPPATAEEYMLRVRLEAERMPVVLRADIPEPESKPEESFDQTLNHVALAECPADYLPTTQWSSSVLKDFVDLRQYMDFWAAHGVGSKDSGRRMPVPAMKDFMGWVIFFFGADGISIVESLFNGDEDNEEKEHQVAQPDKQTGKKRQNRKKRAAKKQPVKQEINDGTKVEANFMRMGHRPGKIVKTHSDGLYDILYDHGAKEVHVQPSQVHVLSEQPCKNLEKLDDALKVKANFMGMGYRLGQIVKTRTDGSYDILYDHGAKEVHVQASQVSALSEQLCKESKEELVTVSSLRDTGRLDNHGVFTVGAPAETAAAQAGRERARREMGERTRMQDPPSEKLDDALKVKANFMGMGHRLGQIVKTRTDGSYDILYDHGAKEVHVPASQVSAFSEQLCKESKGVKSADPVHQDESIASPEETEAASLDQQDYLDKPRESIVENRRDKQWAEVHPEGVAPSLSLILQFDQVLTQKLLGYWVDLLEVLPMNRQASGWIYALLSKIQWPLHRDTAAMLRAILRLCCKQRAQVQEIEDQILPMLNVIILITGNYYKQSDLESN